MILFYTASQDATIYLQQPYQNTGIDEMLELSKVYYGGTYDMSRILIQFDTTEISKSVFDLENTKLNTILTNISSSIYSNNLISSSWSASVSKSQYYSASYNTTSSSLFIANVNASAVSASLFTYTTTTSELSTDYLTASQSVYLKLVPVVSAIGLQSITLSPLSASYALISSSYSTLLATQTGSIADDVLAGSFNTLSASYATALFESTSLLIQSASLYNEIIELNTLFGIVDVVSSSASASYFANQRIPELQTSASVLSGSIYTLSGSASILSSSWNNSNISSSLFSASYNAVSQSTLTIIQNKNYNVPFTASLQLKITKADEIAATFDIEAYAISGSWEMGTGTRFDNLTTNGATWIYRNGDNTNTHWYTTMNGIRAEYDQFVTGEDSGWGGSWYTSSVAKQSFSYTLQDINLDVTDFVKQWNSESFDNNGIILKFSSSAEVNDGVDYGSIKMFSKETNTIYQPKLVITYLEDDVVSGSLTTITDFINSSSYDVSYRCYSPNLKTSYHEGQKVSIKIDARELYPIKQFNTTFAYQVKYYLPSSAYYSVIDTLTKEPIINYSEASRVIQGEFNNLVKLNFSNWPVGRNYTLLVKSIADDNEEIFEIGSFDIYK